VGHARRREHPVGGGDALHLHERAHPLLHPAAAGGVQGHDRQARRRGATERVGDLQAAGLAHRPAHEREVERDEHRLGGADAPLHAHDGLELAVRAHGPRSAPLTHLVFFTESLGTFSTGYLLPRK